jgi:hypothetical protein
MDIQELLGDELYKQVSEKLGDKKLIINDGSMIPKVKFDEVNTAKNELKTQVEAYTKQLADLQTKAVGHDDLTKRITELQAQNEKATTEWESKLAQARLDQAVEIAIMSAKGRNPKAVKAMLDLSAIKIDGDAVTGIEEQIKALKTSDAYLFDGGAVVTGANPPPAAVQTLEQRYADAAKRTQQNPNDQAARQEVFMLREQMNRK